MNYVVELSFTINATAIIDARNQEEALDLVNSQNYGIHWSPYVMSNSHLFNKDIDKKITSIDKASLDNEFYKRWTEGGVF